MANPAPPSAPPPAATSPAPAAAPSTSPAPPATPSTPPASAPAEHTPPGPTPTPAASDSPPAPSPRRETENLDDLLRQIGDGDAAEAPSLDAELTDPRDLERPDKPTVVIESTGAIDFNPEFASFGARFAGFAIDSLVTLVAIAPGVVVFLQGRSAVRILGVVVALVGLLVVARWYGTTVSKTGQWIGNRIAGTKVVDVSSGNMLTVGHAATRFVIRALISPVLLFGFIMAFTNSQRRAFHDQFASSIVTRPTRASWSVDDVEPIDDASGGPASQ